MPSCPLRVLAFLCGISLLGSAISGCSGAVGPESPPPEPGPLLSTSQARYDATLRTDGGYERVVVEVPYTTHNTTSGSLYLIGCNRPPAPVLEKRVDGAWEAAASSSPSSLCLRSPPWEIAPGEAREDTLHFVGYRPGQNILPTFDGEIAGTYRLNRLMYVDGNGEEEDLLPAAQRLSNTFELE